MTETWNNLKIARKAIKLPVYMQGIKCMKSQFNLVREAWKLHIYKQGTV